MIDAIQEIIRKNLPAEVAETLRKHLTDAAEWKKSLDYVTARNADLAKSVELKDVEIGTLRAQLKVAGDLAKREHDVTDRENRLAVTLAECRSDNNRQRVDDLKELMGLAFRNPRFTHTDSVSKSVPVQQNGYVSQQTQTETKTTTTEQT